NMTDHSTPAARRAFLRFLVASPYVAALGGVAAFLQERIFAQPTQGTADVMTNPADALNVLEFEEAARRKVQPGHWAYMATGVDEVNKALGRPVWYQLYAPPAWEANEILLRRVEAAGCSVIALTVDSTTGRNSESYLRTRPRDLTQCNACHEGAPGGGPRPM